MKTYCHHCGAALLPVAAFCHTCGTGVPEEARLDRHIGPYDRAAALARMGDLDEAIAAYTDIIAHQPDDAGAYVALATLRIAARAADEAEGLLREALALDGQHAVAWAYLGALLLERAAIHEAETAFDTALTCGPEDFLVRLKRGEAFLRLGRIFDALDELARAVMLPATDKQSAIYARNLLIAAREQASRAATRIVGTRTAPRRLVRWMSSAAAPEREVRA